VKAGWPLKPLADVCQIKPPKAEARNRVSDEGLVSFVPMEDLGIDQKFLVPTQTRSLGEVSGSYTYFADGDVLLAKITPCFENGKLGIADNLTNGIGFGSSEYIVFRPSPEMDKEWLYYFLSQDSFRVEGAERMTGAVGHKRVAKEFIESYPIPVPPLPEQRRIVAILDEAFDGIATAKANAEQNLQNARALFESQLQQIFTEAWEAGDLVTLADLATDITDGDHMPPPKAASGVPFITIGNVAKDSRTIDFSDTFMVPREYFDSLKPNKKPRIGDVLYTVTGSYGIPVLVKEQQDFCFQRHIGLVRPKPDVRSEWLYYLLMSPQIVQQANDGATGTAQKTVSLKVLRGFEVPRLPLATQEEVTAKLNVFATETQHLESLYQQKLAALDELKKSLLHQAFSGQL